MTYTFGDGFDLYAAVGDMYLGYWDSGTGSAGNNTTLATGRFTGSQCLSETLGNVTLGIKNSGANDAVHHIVCAYRTTVLSGTNAGLYFQFGDGTSAQCSIVFRSDGTILLTSGGPTSTTLATYSAAVSAINTWTAFEFEVIINNTTGSFSARKNGNSSNDFSLGSLNTRAGTSNNYANRLTVATSTLSAVTVLLDDVLWRSDASSVSWAGDLRCLTRMPASDVSTQFTKGVTTLTYQPFTVFTTSNCSAGTARYTPFTAQYTGTVGTVALSIGAAFTGNMKCSLFSDSSGSPSSSLASANTITNLGNGFNTFTFSSPPSVTKGTQYWVGFDPDSTSGSYSVSSASTDGRSSTTAYASFPAASPVVSNASAPIIIVTTTLTFNFPLVAEAQEDGTSSYVYDSTVGHNDLYTIASLSSTPASTFMVTTRGFAEKTDAGSRLGAVQIKSGATTVQSTSTALNTSFGWLFRTDLTDPNTSTTWTNTAVNSVQIGPVVTG